ncbi:hypothetical protein NP233_g9256 [Leucocoprinus birnbaumii]|uniref:Cytochrome P450 n=1 Tax=Leucocoprinus birnbaumii TaxID=56174 RepID=A0AAD5VMH1_9AGAR|nr:hypothetical protein NP233_g9256 [Leucocoprinus birnbaumii]
MKALRHRVNRLPQKAVDRLAIGTINAGNRTQQTENDIDSKISERLQIPDDVIYELGHYLDTYHLQKLLLLNKSIYDIIHPLIWLDIDTRESANPEKQIGKIFKALQLKPEQGLFIRRLVLGADVAMIESPGISVVAGRAVIQLSSQKCLVNLTKFWWFCKKQPTDEMWASLHKNCPSLKDIGIRRGPDDLIIEPASSILKFRDLVGFHLTTHGVYRYHHPNQIEVAVGGNSIPPGLYEMLIEHCPRLRELTFDGSCPEKSIWDVWPILGGTWPELRSLSLGMVKCFKVRRPAAEETIIARFMERHPNLRELRFAGAAHWASHEMVHTCSSHMSLAYFQGRNVQLKPAESVPCLKSVFLTDLFVDSANFSGILRQFGGITRLGLIVDEHQGMVKVMCQSIFDACPLLVHLDLRFRDGLSNYAEIAAISRKAVHLRSLTLVGGVYRPLDNISMGTKGQKIILKNPRLDSFALYFGERFSHADVSGVLFDRFAFGEFTVLRDKVGGRPTGLLIKEVKKGLGTHLGHRYVKEITKNIIPKESMYFVSLLVLSVSLCRAYLDQSRDSSQLNRIPVIGHSGRFTSFISAFKLFKHGREILNQGYALDPGGIFKIPSVDRWEHIVSGGEMVDDLRRAGDDEVDFHAEAAERMRFDYTVKANVDHSTYHTKFVKTKMTSFGSYCNDLHDECVAAVQDLIPATEKDWINVPLWDTMTRINGRMSCRVLVGHPLCREPEFLQLCIDFSRSVMTHGVLINLIPSLIRPVVGPWLSSHEKHKRLALKYLRPVIEERLKMIEEFGEDWPGKPDDIISWMIDEAKGEDAKVENIAMRVLFVNFAAMHNTAMAAASFLLELAARPEYIDALREEAQDITESEGWTKNAVAKMSKLDSFIKESGRYTSMSGVTSLRKVTNPQGFKFSNGITLPYGTSLSVISDAVHNDPSFYDDPETFDGYRFHNLRRANPDSKEEEHSKYGFSAATPNWLFWGVGRHACPGRFFAAHEIKVLLAYILLNHDIALVDDKRPENGWITLFSIPDTKARVLFRRR